MATKREDTHAQWTRGTCHRAAKEHGRIVNVGDTFGLRGRAGRAVYGASKWGLPGLNKSAALEAGPYGVTVNCVCRGWWEGARFDRVRGETAGDVAGAVHV